MGRTLLTVTKYGHVSEPKSLCADRPVTGTAAGKVA